MLDAIVFSQDGSFTGFQDHEVVETEQGSAWIRVLQEQLERGTIGLATVATLPGWWNPGHEDRRWTVAELIQTGHLKVK